MPDNLEGALLIAAATLRLEAAVRGDSVTDTQAVAAALKLRGALREALAVGAEKTGTLGAAIEPTVFAATLASDHDAEPGAPLIGKTLHGYRIDEPAGQGGMGVVYKATRVSDGALVAVKVPKFGSMTPEKLEQITRHTLQEAKALDRIAHPAFVHLVECFSWAGAPVLVIEWIEGTTLQKILEPGPLSVVDALRVVLRVADAMAAAHQAGVMHNDLKPGNLMLSRHYSIDQASIRVLDFGISVIDRFDAALARTAEGTVIGTPMYMSPEQIHAEMLDNRTDVYAMGAILHECLTGYPPFANEGTHVMGILSRRITEEIPPPSALREDLPPVVEDVVVRALARNRDKRTPSAAEFRDEIQFALEDIGSC